MVASDHVALEARDGKSHSILSENQECEEKGRRGGELHDYWPCVWLVLRKWSGFDYSMYRFCGLNTGLYSLLWYFL
jgi:hypothetical protein